MQGEWVVGIMAIAQLGDIREFTVCPHISAFKYNFPLGHVLDLYLYRALIVEQDRGV